MLNYIPDIVPHLCTYRSFSILILSGFNGSNDGTINGSVLTFVVIVEHKSIPSPVLAKFRHYLFSPHENENIQIRAFPLILQQIS